MVARVFIPADSQIFGQMLEQLLQCLTSKMPRLAVAVLYLHPRPCPRYGLFLCWQGTLISQPANHKYLGKC